MPLHGADEEGDETRLQFFRLFIRPIQLGDLTQNIIRAAIHSKPFIVQCPRPRPDRRFLRCRQSVWFPLRYLAGATVADH